MPRIALTAVVAVALAASTVAGADPVWRLNAEVRMPGAAPSWDYLTFDAARSRLFLGRRAAGVTVYDVRSRTVVGQVENSAGANMATLVPQFGRGYTANGDGSTTVFDLATLKAVARIKLGTSADAAFYEPVTRQLAFTRGDDHELTFVDAATGRITARLLMKAEELESVAPAGNGLLYVVERDLGRVATVDARSHTVVAEWPVAGCELPTGAAYDAATRRLFLGCKGDHPVLTVVDVADGRVVAQLPIGRGNDGVVFDAKAHRVFTSNGIDGNVVVFDQLGADDYKLSVAFTTRPIARTMALDPETETIWTMTAEGYVDPAKTVNTRAGAFYPNTYFDDTFRLLEYTPQPRGPAAKADDE